MLNNKNSFKSANRLFQRNKFYAKLDWQTKLKQMFPGSRTGHSVSQRSCVIRGKPLQPPLLQEQTQRHPSEAPVRPEVRTLRWKASWKKDWARGGDGRARTHLLFNRAFFLEPVLQDFILECPCVTHCALLNLSDCCGILHNLDHPCVKSHRIQRCSVLTEWSRGFFFSFI